MFKITSNIEDVAQRLRQHETDIQALQDAINNAHIDMGADDAVQRVDEIINNSACKQSCPEIAENVRSAVHAQIARARS